MHVAYATCQQVQYLYGMSLYNIHICDDGREACRLLNLSVVNVSVALPLFPLGRRGNNERLAACCSLLAKL